MNPEAIEKTKKELRAEERLNKKLMYENLKTTGVLKKNDNKQIDDKHESFLDEIDNLFSS